jgi:hypothetical protein
MVRKFFLKSFCSWTNSTDATVETSPVEDVKLIS